MELNQDDVMRAIPSGVSPDAWCTAVVIKYLQNKLPDLCDEWEFVVDKAKGFIGANVNSILNSAAAFV